MSAHGDPDEDARATDAEEVVLEDTCPACGEFGEYSGGPDLDLMKYEYFDCLNEGCKVVTWRRPQGVMS